MLDQIAVPALAVAAALALYKNGKDREIVENYLPQGMIRTVNRTVAPLDGRCMGYTMDGTKGYAYMNSAYTNFKCKNGAVSSGCNIPTEQYKDVAPKETFQHDMRVASSGVKTIDVLDDQDFIRIENFQLSDPVRSSLYNRQVQQIPFAPASKSGYGLYANQRNIPVQGQYSEGFELPAGTTQAGMAPQVAMDKIPMSELTSGVARFYNAADGAKNAELAKLNYTSVPAEQEKKGEILSESGQVVDNVYMVDRTFMGVTAGGVINRSTSCPFRGDLYVTPCPVGRMDPAQYSQLDGLKTGYIQFHQADESQMVKADLVEKILTSDPTCTSMPSTADASRATFEAFSGKDVYTSMY